MITQRPSFRSSLRVLRVSAVNNTSTAATLRARRGGAQRLHGRLDGAAPVAARGRRARYGQVQTIPDKTYQHPRPSVASVPIRVLFCHPHPLAARNRHSYGSTAGAAQHTATHNAQVLSSWFLVRSSWFSVLIPFALCGRTQRVCGTIPALCCAFIHKLNGGLQSVRSSHSWH